MNSYIGVLLEGLKDFFLQNWWSAKLKWFGTVALDIGYYYKMSSIFYKI